MVLSVVGPWSHYPQQQPVRECDKGALVVVIHSSERYLCKRPQHPKPLEGQCLTPHILGNH